ncbi:MAG: HEAT repeat domain-containing protein [Myxococcota bacterium]
MTDDSRPPEAKSKSARLEEEARYRKVLTQRPGDPKAVPALIAHLGDPSWRIRKAAVAMLDRFSGEATLIPALVAGLASDENAGLRNACSQALGAIGEPSVEHLVKVLETQNPDHRRVIVEALGTIGHSTARGPLIACLDDPDQNVRASVAEALGRLGDPVGLRTLCEHLASDGIDLIQRVFILDALARSETRLPFADLEPWIGDHTLARPVLALLGWCGDPRATEHLVACVGDPSRQMRVAAARGLATLLPSLDATGRADVVARLGRTGAVKKQLTELLDHPEDEVAGAAVDLLGLIADPETAPAILHACACRTIVERGESAVMAIGPSVVGPLLRDFDDFDIESRVLFLEIIEALGDAAILGKMLDIAQGPETRSAETAIRVVGSLAGPDAVEPLMRLAAGADSSRAHDVAMALTRIGERHPTEVATALRHAIEGGAACAAWLSALGDLARDEDVDLAIAAAHHRDSEVRCAAIDSALSFGALFPLETVMFALADEHATVRGAAARALGSYKGSDAPDAVGALIAATGDSDPWVVAAAILSLGRFHHPRAVESVVAAAGSTSSPIAIAALQSLFRLNPADTVDVVRRALKHADPEVAREAISLSMRLSEDEARPLLVEALEHRSWSVRGTAAMALRTRDLVAPPDVIESLLISESDPLVLESLQQLLRDSGGAS